MPPDIDEQTIELIAERVTSSLRRELEAIVGELHSARRPLTVEDVAERFGVARSTVYAHWREWGGYKVSDAEKAPIRFDGAALSRLRPSSSGSGEAPTRPPARRDLLHDNPKGDRSPETAR
jgi:transposase-like protein